MKRYFFRATLFLAFFAFGCGASQQNRSQGPVLRAAVDAPEFFEARSESAVTGNSCTSPMVDPNDGTEIVMVTSFANGIGDYAVTGGKYGVKEGELLRINCSTGEVLGIVKK